MGTGSVTTTIYSTVTLVSHKWSEGWQTGRFLCYWWAFSQQHICYIEIIQHIRFYTARQLSGITLSVRPFALQLLVKIYVNFNWSPLTICKRPLATVWQSCMVNHHLCCSPDHPLMLGVLISPIAPKAMCCIYFDHIQHWAVTVCKLLFQTKTEITLIYIRPIIIEIIVWFSGPKLSHKVTGVSQGAMWKVLHRVRDTSSPFLLTWFNFNPSMDK